MRVTTPFDTTVLYETTDHAELAALEEALRTHPATGGYCMCPGTIVFDFGTRQITLHHGETLRWDGSNGNRELCDRDAVMDWLSARGITFVREEYEAAKVRDEADVALATQWQAAMPASLRPFFDDMRQTGKTTDPAWTAAIEAEFPEPVARTRVLLALFASGTGLDSGYPSWEAVPLDWLVATSADVLVSAIGDAPTEAVVAGAVRLLESWDFRKRRRQLCARLPAALRERLLEHATATGREQAARALRVV